MQIPENSNNLSFKQITDICFNMPVNTSNCFADKTSSMPFSLVELVPMTLMLRDSCLGIIELAHPDAKPMVTEEYKEALRMTGVREINKQTRDEETRRWAYLFKVKFAEWSEVRIGHWTPLYLIYKSPCSTFK